MNSKVRSLIMALVLVVLGPVLSFAQPRVLILYCDDPTWGNDIVNKVSKTGRFSVVDGLDGRYTAPSLSTLQKYDAVMVWDNYGPAAGLGDVLADYVEGGGGVVTAMFTIGVVPLGGKFNNSTYQVLSPGGYYGGNTALGSVALPNHDIMKNVKSFDGGYSYRSGTSTVVSNAYNIAFWKDGTSLIAARENVGAKKVRRAELNFFPPSSDAFSGSGWLSSTDGTTIIANALIWVVGAPPSQAQFSTKSLSFGTVSVGDASTLCLTVKSVGEAPLKITGASISGVPDYTIISGPAVDQEVPIGGSVQYCVRFSPLGTGARNATLNLTTNGRDSGTAAVSLSGSGSAAIIKLSDNTMFRKTRTRLTETSSQCLTIQNTGTGPLRIDSIILKGLNANEYYFPETLPKSVLPGELANLCIGFRPRHEGRSDAQIVIYSNSFIGPVSTVTLYGTGTLARLKLTPATLNFDSVFVGEEVCRTIVLSNPGSDTLRIPKNYRTGGDLDFRYSTIDSMILPEGSMSMEVCFKPLMRGYRVSSYAIQTSIPLTFDAKPRDTSLFYLSVLGTGVPVGGIAINGRALEPSIIGEEQCVDDTLVNVGQAPFTISSAMIAGGDASDFTLTGLTLPMTLMPGDAVPVRICITPSARGQRATGILMNGTSEGKVLNLNIPLVGQGLLLCAEADQTGLYASEKVNVSSTSNKTVTITNCGDVARAYTGELSSGATMYSIVSPTTTAVIAPNGTATFELSFAPTAIGDAPATLTVTGGKDPIVINLSGIGAGVSVAPSGAAGMVARGDCKTFDVTIMNTGNLDWTPGAASIGGANAADFTVVSGPTPATIAAGASGTVSVKFCPSMTGSETATLNFASSNPTPIGTTLPYTLTGEGIVSSVAWQTASDGYALRQNYPNPFNPSTSIEFALPESALVTLRVLDLAGKVVATPVNETRFSQGMHPISFSADGLMSGTYVYELNATNGAGEVTVLSRKMSLQK